MLELLECKCGSNNFKLSNDDTSICSTCSNEYTRKGREDYWVESSREKQTISKEDVGNAEEVLGL